MTKCRDAIRTRDGIIASATKLFAINGYDGVSVDEIAKEASINKAMIYYYFGNKAKLYEITVKSVLDEMYDSIVEQNRSLSKPTEELKSFIITYAFFAKEHSYIPALMMAELSNGGKNLPEGIFAGLKYLFSLLSDILKRGAERGCFKKTKPMVIHFMIVGTINLFITTSSLRNKITDSTLDVCKDCEIEEIAEYLFANIETFLKDER